MENLVGEHTGHKGTSSEFKYCIDEDVIGKYLSGSSTTISDNLGVHLAVLKKLKAVIDASIEVEEHANYKKVNKKRSIENGLESDDLLMHRFYGAVTIDGQLYRVKTSFKEFHDDAHNQPYNYQVTELELLISGSKASDALSNPSSITGAKLLKGVEKSYDPGKKILDESEKSSEGEPAELHRFGSAMEELKLEGEERQAVRGMAEEVAREMGIEGDVEFVDGSEEGLSRKQKGVKAWFDSSTGKVTVNLANAEGAADVEMSLLHEGAGHKGLRAMFGERFKQFLG